jgi:hypothetical protein
MVDPSSIERSDCGITAMESARYTDPSGLYQRLGAGRETQLRRAQHAGGAMRDLRRNCMLAHGNCVNAGRKREQLCCRL